MAITLTPHTQINCARPGCAVVTTVAVSVFDGRYGQICPGCYPVPLPEPEEDPMIPPEYLERLEPPF